MNKQEFIDRLRAALNGRVAPGVVNDNINYYEEYINMEIRKGRTEEDVLQSLGDPRLIAKTIIATNSKGGQGDYQESTYQNSTYQDSTYQGYGYRNEESNDPVSKIKTFHLPGWLWSIIGIAIVVLVVCVVFSILSFLAPVLIAVFVVLFLVKLFRDWLN